MLLCLSTQRFHWIDPFLDVTTKYEKDHKIRKLAQKTLQLGIEELALKKHEQMKNNSTCCMVVSISFSLFTLLSSFSKDCTGISEITTSLSANDCS